jgi:2-dehydro-3-deoxyphosphogluconate aldolase/(4S)-4-hydroxy-2-oxoglutarate aldolase
MCVGSGTVLDPETARAAILAGADFILSPTLSTKVIEVCHRYGKLAIPGVFTPTEILTAWEAGARLVKVFPARVLGPEFLKDVKGPLSQVELMPVGGVSKENAADFIHCGAHSLGIGSQLVNVSRVKQGQFGEIAEKAAEFVQLVNKARLNQ